jgi:hypothetical protein
MICRDEETTPWNSWYNDRRFRELIIWVLVYAKGSKASDMSFYANILN